MLLLPLALAHSPHDVTSVVSVATDGSVATVEDDAIALSPDGWAVSWRGFPFATPGCVLARGAGSVVALVPDEGAWDTDDDGVTWTFRGGPVEARRCLRAGDAWFVAAADGVWTTDDGRVWSPLGPAPLFGARDVAVDPSAAPGAQVFLVQDDGTAFVLSADEATWMPIGAGPYRAVAAGEGATLLAPETGPLQEVIGGEPAPLDGAPADVRAVAVGSVWLAATATEAVWVSADAGARWELSAAGLEPLSTGSGSPDDGVHYDELVVTADRWWLASWEGLFHRAPDATRWSQVPLRTLPLVNTLHWLGDELLVGTNGGGLYRGVPGTSEWSDVSGAIGWPWMRQLSVVDDGWFVGAGNVVYVSLDEGASWEVPASHLPTGGDVVVASPEFATDRLVLFGGVDADGRAAVARSEDGGSTWTPVALPGECRIKPGFGAMSATWAWVSCREVVYGSTDGGASWVALGSVPAAPVALVAGGEELVWIATEAGLYRSSGGGAPTLVGWEGAFLTALALQPDGEPLVAVRGGGLATAAGPLPGWPAVEPVEALAVSAEGVIAVGSHLGLSVSTDGGARFVRACPYDRYDDRDQAFWWEGWEEREDHRAKAQWVKVGRAGARAEWAVDGEGITLVGGGEAATLEVEVDGEVASVEVQDARTPTVLYRRTLPAGRHEVVVRVIAGEVALDGGERWRWDPPEAPADDDTGTPADPPGCGCGGGSAGVLGAWVWAGIRRRRGRRAAGSHRVEQQERGRAGELVAQAVDEHP